MIAKVIAAPKGTSSMMGLARYITGVESAGHPIGWPALADYIADARSNGARVDYVRFTNLESVELGPAVAEMMFTQAQNRRVRDGNVYHMVVAFPHGEVPTRAQLDDIEDSLCAAIGLQSHQRMSAAHDDKDHFHIHIAINKIHPETLRCVTPYFDKKKLMSCCAELEVRHGLTLTHDRDPEQQSVAGKVADMEAHAGRESFASWLGSHAAKPLGEAATKATSWADLHETAATLGLRLVLRGAGLAITTEDGKVGAKASSVDRSLSFSKLSAQLGPFKEREARERAPARDRYIQGPRDASVTADTLFATYTKQREVALAARRKNREHTQERMRQTNAALKARFGLQREGISRSNRLPADKRRLYRRLGRERQGAWAASRANLANERHAAAVQNPLPTWTGFLQEQASFGDLSALKQLRIRRKTQAEVGACIQAAGSLEAAIPLVVPGRKPKVLRNGDMIYDLRGGGRVIDTKHLVRVEEVTQGSTLLALGIAEKRFEGQQLKLTGTAEFKDSIVLAAIAARANVCFEDAALEARRAAGLPGAVPPQSNAAAPSVSAAGPLEAFIDRSNETGLNERSAGHYRAWAASDVGSCLYKGLWALEDGSEVMVMRRGSVMLVKPATAEDLSRAPSLRIGDTVTVNAMGSISRVQGLRR